MTIHKEGRVILFVLLIVLFVVNIIAFAYFPYTPVVQYSLVFCSVIFFLLILQFFRNPVFAITRDDKKILAPADGKVVVIEETVEGEYLKVPRRQISIFMSPLNVHVNRLPVGGEISYFKYHPGKYLVAWHPKSSLENERTTIVVRMRDGVEILLRQIAGALARRIRFYVQQGEQVEQGQEFGFIKFGSRVDVFLPLDAKILVKVGDVTKGGRTVLAEI